MKFQKIPRRVYSKRDITASHVSRLSLIGLYVFDASRELQ